MSKKTLFYTLNGSLRCLSAPPPLPSPPFQAIPSPVPPTRQRPRRRYNHPIIGNH
ncbi:hypothetical protein [Segatella copri]|uniref:hypothetical protein n=1 Tax=Segatella copri TaxID=165179 RepID=UPI0019315CA7|nr:hypothetical protein [Segatella copri]